MAKREENIERKPEGFAEEISLNAEDCELEMSKPCKNDTWNVLKTMCCSCRAFSVFGNVL